MHGQVTNPIEYMYPPKWLRSLFITDQTLTSGRDSANCTGKSKCIGSRQVEREMCVLFEFRHFFLL